MTTTPQVDSTARRSYYVLIRWDGHITVMDWERSTVAYPRHAIVAGSGSGLLSGSGHGLTSSARAQGTDTVSCGRAFQLEGSFVYGSHFLFW